MILFSDRGTPDGYHMHGYSGHTFKFVNAQGEFHYVQVHLKREGGAKSLVLLLLIRSQSDSFFSSSSIIIILQPYPSSSST